MQRVFAIHYNLGIHVLVRRCKMRAMPDGKSGKVEIGDLPVRVEMLEVESPRREGCYISYLIQRFNQLTIS